MRQIDTRRRQIRVGYLINSLNVGGAERFVCDLTPRLDPDRFFLSVTCLYAGGPLLRELEESGVPVRVLGLERGRTVRNWAQLWRYMREAQFDVMHTHLPEASWYGLPAAYFQRIPARISHIQNVHPQWRTKDMWVDRAAATFASISIACSEAVGEFARSELHYQASRLTVLHNGIDTGRFDSLPDRGTARRLLGLPENGHVLLCAATLGEQKGHRFLFEAMVQVRAQFQGALLLLAGRSTADRATTLREITAELGIAGNILLLGERDDIPTLMAASDLFVLPSVWEGLPVVLIEAAAAGLPAVATAVGGSPEVVQDRVTGLVVPPKDPDRLAGALVSLLRNPQRLRSMASAARSRAREEFDTTTVARRLEELYVDLLDGQ